MISYILYTLTEYLAYNPCTHLVDMVRLTANPIHHAEEPKVKLSIEDSLEVSV